MKLGKSRKYSLLGCDVLVCESICQKFSRIQTLPTTFSVFLRLIWRLRQSVYFRKVYSFIFCVHLMFLSSLQIPDFKIRFWGSTNRKLHWISNLPEKYLEFIEFSTILCSVVSEFFQNITSSLNVSIFYKRNFEMQKKS